jgi:hypothetical protein
VHHERLVEPVVRDRVAAVAHVQQRGLRERREQLVRGVRREDRGTGVPGRVAVHSVALAVERVEPRVGVPGLVEVDAVNRRIEQLGNAPGVVAQAVVGRVGDDGMDGARLDHAGDERVGADRLRDGLRPQVRGGDGADDPETVPHGDQVGGHAAGQHEPVLDRLVAVAVAQGDLVAAHRRREDDAVGGRRAVGHAVGTVCAEDSRRELLVLADGAGVIEQRPEVPDAH